MPMTSKQMISLLQSHDFEAVRQKGSHVIMKRNDITVVVPLHNKDLGKGLENKILKDAGLK